MGVYEKLLNVQKELKAPKNQYNSFGKYKYRSCEDVLEGLKPVLDKYKATLFITDDIVVVEGRFYVKATATFVDTESGEKLSNTAFARESDAKKGMDESQVTGATSSYARKYALNGLFLIDDTKDSDTNEYQQEKANKQTKVEQPKETKSETTEPQEQFKPTNNKIGEKEIEAIKAELARTGIDEKTIFGMFKVNGFEEITEIQHHTIMNKFAKTPSKKEG